MAAELKEVKNQVNDDIVSLLKSALRDAEAGNLQSLVLCGLDGNRNVVSGYHCKGRQFTLIGALRVLEREIIDDQLPLSAPSATE